MANQLPETYRDDMLGNNQPATEGTLVSPEPAEVFSSNNRNGIYLTESGLKLSKPNDGIHGRLRPDGHWNIGIHGNTFSQKPYFPDLELSGNQDERFGKIALTFQKDILEILRSDTTNLRKQELFGKYNIHIPREHLHDDQFVRTFVAAFVIGNSWVFESLDPSKKDGLFSELGIRIDDGRATINDAGLIQQLGFSGFFGVSLGEGGAFSNQTIINIRNSIEQSNGGSTEQVALISFSDLVARMTIRKPIMQGDDSVLFGKVFGEVRQRSGVYFGGGIERIDMTGRGYNLDIGYGKSGPLIRFGRNDKLAGGENFARTFTAFGKHTELHYTPGFHIIDSQGQLYGQMNDVFQFMHHAPEMGKLFQEIMSILDELGEKKQIILHREFAAKLNSPQRMKEFFILLQENRKYFLSEICPYESIHFNDTDKKETHTIQERLSQIHISSLKYRYTDKTENGETVKISEQKISTKLSEKYNINIRTSIEITPNVLQAIDMLIGYLEKHNGIEKIRGKNITISPDMTSRGGGEEMVHHFITSSQIYQEIIIPVGVLESMSQGTTPIIPFTQDNTDKNRYNLLRDYFSFDQELIPVIQVVKDDDPLLFDSGSGEAGAYKQYRGDNGVLILSETYFAHIEKKMRKGRKGNLSMFDKLSLGVFESTLKGAQIRNIDYISKEVQKVFQTSNDARINLAREMGGTTLYDIRPNKEKDKEDAEYTHFDVHKSVTHEYVGTFGIRIDEDGLHIDFGGDNTYHISNPGDPRAQLLFQKYTWLEKFLFGVKGKNPRNGKIEYLRANIQKIAINGADKMRSNP